MSIAESTARIVGERRPGRAITCATREEWLLARRRGIGASEAGAILGVSPWRTPLEVYFDKLGMLPPSDKPRLAWGLRFENVIAEAYVELTGIPLQKPESLLVHADYPWMLASLDRRAADRPVELKRVSHFAARDFGEAGTEEIPQIYYFQVQQQMGCSGFEVADLAALIGDDDFRIYTIRRNDEVIEMLAEVEREFMERVTRQDPPMPDFEHPSTAALLALIEPEPDTSIVLGEDAAALVAQYEALGDDESGAKNHRKEVKARLLHLMGTAECGVLPDGRLLTRKIVERDGYTVAPTTFVDMRIKSPAKRKGK